YCPHLWDDIGEQFFAADLVIANLETPVLLTKPKSLVPEVMLSEMHFNADREMFDLFNGQDRFKGFDFLSTANNHSMDMGEEGVMGSIEFLRSKGIKQQGIASNAEEAIAPVYIEIKGIRFAFMSWTYSLNKCKVPDDKTWMVNYLRVNESGVDLNPIIEQAREAKINGKANVLILSLHYGNAYQSYPGMHIRKNTSRIFGEAGIDLILGGHPHNMQPMESYPFTCPWTSMSKKGWVIYSLGDFVAYDIYTLCHMPIWLQIKWNVYDAEDGKRQVLMSELSARPIYLMGNYESDDKRDLRLLDALQLEALIIEGKKPDAMPAKLIPEFTALMAYYRRHFNVAISGDRSRA
ncbi:MAG: CapA family protein, partial [Saprospiraceae bacterium]